jgi:hypothetical protein
MVPLAQAKRPAKPTFQFPGLIRLIEEAAVIGVADTPDHKRTTEERFVHFFLLHQPLCSRLSASRSNRTIAQCVA